MSRRTFRVAIAAEPIEFDLDCPVRGMQNFHCRDRLAAGTLMKFAELFAGIDPDGDGKSDAGAGADAIPAVRDFFNSAIMPEARDRFWAIINDEDEGIPMDTLVEIAGWLAEVYSGDRPTTATSSATSGVPSTGAVSPASQPQPDTQTYSRSELTSSST